MTQLILSKIDEHVQDNIRNTKYSQYKFYLFVDGLTDNGSSCNICRNFMNIFR